MQKIPLLLRIVEVYGCMQQFIQLLVNSAWLIKHTAKTLGLL